MKVNDLIKTLQHIASSQGDIDVVIQDSEPLKYPDCCKHESFFIVEEPKDAPGPLGMEVVLRTWPY